MTKGNFLDDYTKTITDMAYEDQSAIEHNERMKNESDRLSEYLEMKAIYEDGLLEF